MRLILPSRRRFMHAAVGATALAATAFTPRQVQAGVWPPTESNIEGPYYRKGAPFRQQLYGDDEPGLWLAVWGNVYATDATPLPGAVIDIWQADGGGAYDNASKEYRGRGVQLADETGAWWVWTTWPGYYPGRPYHLHVKVSHKGFRPLTTQLYFRDDPRAPQDQWYRPSLELDWFLGEEETWAGAYFDFVLAYA